MKTGFHGKVIYNPSGRAGEYSNWAANFYIGCMGDNSCKYCYCPATLRGYWPEKPTLKKSLINETKAFDFFMNEVAKNYIQLKENGLFFNFVSDPFFPETILLNCRAMRVCIIHGIHVKSLTKQTWWVDAFIREVESNGTFWNLTFNDFSFLISFGFTLTGHNELEPGAAPNSDRIEAMKKLYNSGFKTWASIEPIIDIPSSLEMICQTKHFCDLYKIGLQSGKKYFQPCLREFTNEVHKMVGNTPVYWKDSFIQQAGISREELPGNCVNRDFNL